MSNHRYVLRSAVFAAVYLAAFLATLLTPLFPPGPLAVAAVWLIAQARYGLRRFDVIMLATAAAVGATVQGAGLLTAITAAVGAVLPALLFAVLLERRLPGYWRGHGDRFRRPGAVLLVLAGLALLAAATEIVIRAVIDIGFRDSAVVVPFVRDAVLLFLAPLTVNTAHRLRSPRRRGLTVVR